MDFFLRQMSPPSSPLNTSGEHYLKAKLNDIDCGRTSSKESILGEIPFVSDSSRLLLHSCCAPCSGSMIKMLLDEGINVTILWYNPNIHPRAEYEIRKNENLKYAIKYNIPFVDLDYDVKEWYERAKGMEYDPERGERCTMCFDMRMERTALYASENGFRWFTTTNATSRWKDLQQVNQSGLKAAQKYENVNFWEFNWQTDELTLLKYEISAQEKFYKQEYCGCQYSLRDSNLYRKSQGLKPIVIGGGGVFSDPIQDADEESEEVVNSFFKSADSNFNDERRKIYANRKKSMIISSSIAEKETVTDSETRISCQDLNILNNW